MEDNTFILFLLLMLYVVRNAERYLFLESGFLVVTKIIILLFTTPSGSNPNNKTDKRTEKRDIRDADVN